MLALLKAHPMNIYPFLLYPIKGTLSLKNPNRILNEAGRE